MEETTPYTFVYYYSDGTVASFTKEIPVEVAEYIDGMSNMLLDQNDVIESLEAENGLFRMPPEKWN